MEATAQVRHLRVTAQKARRVVDLARGGVATDVVASLRFQPQAVAEPIRKVIESAIANARFKADEAGRASRRLATSSSRRSSWTRARR